MDKTLISDSEYLFALCITDGLLEKMDERQKPLLLSSITKTLRRINPQIATEKHAKSIKIMRKVKIMEKYQNNLMRR